MARANPVGRRAPTTRTIPSNYVRTSLLFGAHSSSRLLVASVPRQLCYMDHSAAELSKPHPLRSTLLVSALGRISSPPAGRMDHSAAELSKLHPSSTQQACSLRGQPACFTLRLCELPAQAPKSPVDLYLFFARRGLGICTTRYEQAYWNQPLDQRHGLRLLREPIGLHIPLLTEPDRPTFAGSPWTTGTVL